MSEVKGYVIKVNDAWLTEIKCDATTITLVGSDVKQDAEVFEGLGEVIEALRVLRLSGVDVTGIGVEEAD